LNKYITKESLVGMATGQNKTPVGKKRMLTYHAVHGDGGLGHFFLEKLQHPSTLLIAKVLVHPPWLV